MKKTSKEKALEVARNISNTLNKLKDTVIGANALRGNAIWSSTKPSKSMLEGKLTQICKKHKIKKEEL